MARGPASSRSGTPGHRRVEVEALEGVLPVAGWPEAHVPLPGQRLDQRARALVEDRFQVPVRAVSRQHVTELGDGQRPVAQRLAHRRPEVGPVRRGEPVVLHPARQLPLPPGRSEREVDAAVLGREVVHRPAERERLDHRPVRQRLRQLAGPRPRTPGPHGKLGEGLVHRQHRTEPAYDVGHRLGPNRVEQVSLQPPGQRLAPRDRDVGRGGHVRSLAPIPDDRRPLSVGRSFLA